ncbi:MAG: PQQ-dependent sugar dehydrogenase [Pseudomonadota bacterium]
MPWLNQCFIAVLISICSTSVFARGQYLDWWEEYYSDSRSSDSGCQLCHQNSGGGNGWNRYGWAIRTPFVGQFTDAQALINRLDAAADQDSSDAVDAIDYIDEIRYQSQPGWSDGATNTIFFSNGTTTTNESPPASFQAQNIVVDISFTEAVGAVDAISSGSTMLSTQEVATGFTAPLKALTAPGIAGSLFVVEQGGRVFRVDLTDGSKTLFMDISDQLVALNNGYDERGLLGLAFHPDFSTNGLFYTYQSRPRIVSEDSLVDFTPFPPNVAPDHRSYIVEHRASDPSCNSSIQQTKVLMVIDQPAPNHNGGDLAFGPDQMLYVSLGDGGNGGDKNALGGDNNLDVDGFGLFGNGRNLETVLGTILRVDVDGNNSSNGRYGVPVDNPMVGEEGLDEIYAYGFRNPFRISFDHVTQKLYAGDVGQQDIEEIDDVQSGGNYGWNYKEGSLFYIEFNDQQPFVSEDAVPYAPNDLIDPLVEYDHDEGISVTGGYVYRGSQVEDLEGLYVFADYLGGFDKKLLYFDPDPGEGGSPTIEKALMPDLDDNVTGFGEDVEKELYFLTNPSVSPTDPDGRLMKIAAAGAGYKPPVVKEEEQAQCPDDDLCFPIVISDTRSVSVCL